MDRRIVAKALCISAVCCILVSNISYADIDCKKLKKENCEYTIENLNNLNEAYRNATNTNEKLVLLTKIECITNKLEGESSICAFYNALNYANIYSAKKDLKLQKKYIDKAKAIADKIEDNKELLAKYYDELGGFYANTENYYEAIKALKIADNLAQTESIKIRLATSYVAIKDFKNAEIEFEKLFKMISDNDMEIDSQLRTLAQKMYFYKDQYDFKNTINTYKNTKLIYGKTANKDANIEIELYMPIIALYNDLEDVAKLKLAIDKTYKLALEANNEDAEYYTYGEYITYARRLEDKRLTKKYIEKKEQIAKKMFKDKNIVNLEVYPDYAEYFDLANDKGNAELYAKKVASLTKENVDVAPLIYAMKLLDLAEKQSKNGKIDSALKSIAEANEIYIKAYPQISFKFYDLEDKYGEVYKNAGDVDKGIEHYKKAETILKKLTGKLTGELRDVNEHIAELYVQKGDLDEAVKYADKTISISSQIFGQNHIKTVKALLLKAKIYASLGRNDIRDSVIKIINDTIDNGIDCYIGYFTYDYNDFLFDVYVEKGEYDKALNCAEIMYEEARGKWHKENANKKLSQVYKLQDKKFKSLKYKVKSIL